VQRGARLRKELPHKILSLVVDEWFRRDVRSR
jgi:hypothetical protein